MEAFEAIEEGKAMIVKANEMVSANKKTMSKSNKSMIKDYSNALLKQLKKSKPETMTEGDIMNIRSATEQLKLSMERD